MLLKESYFTPLSGIPADIARREIAAHVFQQVFRHDFNFPGVALILFSEKIESKALRAYMVDLKNSLGEIYRQQIGGDLGYLSLGRFNQQTTTKFHLDGAPEESYLMLGYEPTEVQSTLSLADYSRTAHDWKIDPKTLLADYNPMFPANAARLAPYVSSLNAFNPALSQIVIFNNSSQPYREGSRNSLGLMHQATITTPLPDRSRIVNSSMIAKIVYPEKEVIGLEQQRAFIETDAVSGAMYG